MTACWAAWKEMQRYYFSYICAFKFTTDKFSRLTWSPNLKNQVSQSFVGPQEQPGGDEVRGRLQPQCFSITSYRFTAIGASCAAAVSEYLQQGCPSSSCLYWLCRNIICWSSPQDPNSLFHSCGQWSLSMQFFTNFFPAKFSKVKWNQYKERRTLMGPYLECKAMRKSNKTLPCKSVLTSLLFFLTQLQVAMNTSITYWGQLTENNPWKLKYK